MEIRAHLIHREYVQAMAQLEPETILVKLYVGNLPWSLTSADLEELFTPFGAVESAQVVTDRDTGRSRGFGFVEMAAEYASQAIARLNGHQIESRTLRVNEAQSKRAASF